MNIERLQLMVTMLKEVEAGTWKPSLIRAKEIADKGRYNNQVVGHMPSAKKIQTSPVEFDLSSWVSSIPEDRNELTCGFSACAIGHATLDSRFNKMGLKPERNFSPTYRGGYSWEALIKFFELEEGILESLFMSNMYPSRLKDKALVVQVRRRIEKLLQIGEHSFENTKLGDHYWSDVYYVSPQGRIYKEYK